MTQKIALLDLVAEIEKGKKIFKENFQFYKKFKKKDFSVLGKRTAAAMVLSQVFTDFYTSAETIFLRISQFFENSLRKEEWHKDLLKKMTLTIKEIRKAAITDETYKAMDEILRFRHFRRYYFELEYDWDRIEFIEKKYIQCQKLLPRDLDSFIKFLRNLLGRSR